MGFVWSSTVLVCTEDEIMQKAIVTGGMGFIGINLTQRLLQDGWEIKIIDNLSTPYPKSPKFMDDIEFLKCDLADSSNLKKYLCDADVVFHLSANSDISKSAVDTFIDVQQTILNTYNVLEAMRENGLQKIVYTSGSGVYGNLGTYAPSEEYGPLNPVSLYGATKLSAEALISSYCDLFGIDGVIFRFANVVGPYQTHGVSYDFVNRLHKNSEHLQVLGNGMQSKSYVHVNDVVSAMLLGLCQNSHLSVYNVSSGDYISVRDIAEIVIKEMGLETTQILYQESNIGWPGDVAVVRFDDKKIRKLGWVNQFNSRDAIIDSVKFQVKQLS